MEMTIGDYTYEEYPSDDGEEITIEVTDREGEFVSQYSISLENNEVVDYSGVAELDGDDILFIRTLGVNINEEEFLV